MEENKLTHNKEDKSPPSTDDSPQQDLQLNVPSTDEANAEAEQPLTLNQPPVTEQDMEVHHHAHDPAAPHHKKNWKSYFWEFLMLFLAVFCGFLAEYQLEHKIERDRAKELAKSFYEELKTDSASIVEKIQNRIKMENSLQYLISYFKDSSINNLPKQFVINFHTGVMFNIPTVFEPRMAVLEQLKNSGSLRYFKSNELQKLVGDISVAIQNVNERKTIEASYRQTYLTPFIIKHYDYEFEIDTRRLGAKNLIEFISNYENSNTEVPFKLRKPEIFDAGETNNMLSLFAITYRGSRTLQFQKYIDVNAELLRVLRKEYHLK
jgi:hypothetical protein